MKVFRIAPMTPPYQRGLGEDTPRSRQRRPRRRCKKHLELVSQLPCAVPGCFDGPVHVAHIRYACAAEGADIVGKSMKPDDWRTLPLCVRHHIEGRRAQHRMNEMRFWADHGINPYGLARAMWNVTGDLDLMSLLIEHAPRLFPSRHEL